MRLRLGLALLVTVILVGGASWVRFARATPAPAGLVAIQNNKDTAEPTNDTVTKASADLAAGTSNASTTEKLTQTDLIGRQFISDYMNLTSTGQATGDNLTALAGTYADNIASLGSSPSITKSDLTIVPTSNVSLQAYSDALAATYIKYQKLMDAEFGGNKDLSTLGPDFVAFASDMQMLYQRQADEFKSLPVPASIVENEVKLINNYLSDAAAFKALANVDKDPAGSFAAIVTQQQNNTNEKTILIEIGNILDAGGIIARTP